MRIDLNQYVTELSYTDVLDSNVITCTNYEGFKTVLVRSKDINNDTLTFENEFFLMKNNIILSVGDKEIGNFHILVCKKTDESSIIHFERVCDYLFVKRNEQLTADEMLKLFNSLETIFSTSGSKDILLEIGLYGELSLLNYLYEKNNELYKMWHAEFFSKHDLELDDKVKIEVKATVKDIRKHTFSHNQIVRTHLKIFIASFMLQTVEKGLSLYDLCNDSMRLLNSEQLLSLELQMKKLGLSEQYNGISCIKEETYDNLKFYKAEDIPHIIEEIQEGISNIHYDVDLTNTKCIDLDQLK